MLQEAGLHSPLGVGWSLGEQSCLPTRGGLAAQSPDGRLCDLGQVPSHPDHHLCFPLSAKFTCSPQASLKANLIPSCCNVTFSPLAQPSLACRRAL